MSDERDEAREHDTLLPDTEPGGLERPPDSSGQPPQVIEGAPAYFGELIEKLDNVMRQNAAILKNQEMMLREAEIRNAETRARFRSHELDIESLRASDERLTGRVDDLEVRLGEHLSSHTDDDDR